MESVSTKVKLHSHFRQNFRYCRNKFFSPLQSHPLPKICVCFFQAYFLVSLYCHHEEQIAKRTNANVAFLANMKQLFVGEGMLILTISLKA